MSTFAQLKETLLRDFVGLRYLKELRPYPHPTHLAKEREIGQHCCEAEEALSPSALLLLKEELRLSEDQWRRYKLKSITGRSPGEEV